MGALEAPGTLVTLVTVMVALVTAVSACPGKCVCRSSTVDCSNQGLDEIPKNIPRDTVKL